MPVAECINQLTWVWFGHKARPLEDAVYYDSASRGPLGSLKLLFRLRLRFDVAPFSGRQPLRQY
jgi:hypothetical protein